MVPEPDLNKNLENALVHQNQNNEKEWRSQSKRSKEVRDISKILASLEPGSTPAKKLMLAVRFEEQIFKSCKSQEEYQKKLMKRLKKLQKTYKPPQLDTIEGVTKKDSQAKGNPISFSKKEPDEVIERELRLTYGAKLLFIIEHAAEALTEMQRRQGEQGTSLLKKHVDNVAQWAIEIGTVPESYNFYKGEKRYKGVPRASDYLIKLRKYLEQTVNTIRHHVMKLTNPDLYLEEELTRIENIYNNGICKQITAAVNEVDEKALGVSDLQRKILIEKALQFVPPLQRDDLQELKNARLSYFNKISSATDLIASMVATKEAFKIRSGDLQKMHKIAIEGFNFLEENCHDSKEQKREMTLEDAWQNIMVYSNENLSHTDEMQQTTKRQKRHGLVLKARVLCMPGRKISTNLLKEIESKNAKFLRPTVEGVGARLIVTFGSVFEMIVFLSPLVVHIRALSIFTQIDNYSNRDRSSSSLPKSKRSASLPSSINMCVGGVEGSSTIVRHLVAKKLDHASANATHILRRCFGDIVGPYYEKENCSDFELEVTEMSALLKFLQIAKETYSH